MLSFMEQFLATHAAARRVASQHPAYTLLAALSLSILFLFLWLWNGRRYRLPPGPRGIPILGNLLQMKAMRDEIDHKAVRPSQTLQ
jgi:hypothetical protein